MFLFGMILTRKLKTAPEVGALLGFDDDVRVQEYSGQFDRRCLITD